MTGPQFGVDDDQTRPTTTPGRRPAKGRVADKGKQITGTAREKLAQEMKKQYDQGMSIRAIAEAHGRSYGFVHRVLTETDVSLRARGGNHPPQRLEDASRSR